MGGGGQPVKEDPCGIFFISFLMEMAYFIKLEFNILTAVWKCFGMFQ